LIYYLIRSYDYFINNLYQTQASGPSVFQYPITSSELMSFSVLILFAFLINEKSNWKHKLLVLILFLINLLALMATYKRTGWMGAAAGVLLIIILSRRWFLLIAASLILIAAVFLSKNVSRVYLYDYNHSVLKKVSQVDMESRAYGGLLDDTQLFVSGFEKGLLELKDSNIIASYKLPSPIIDLKKWSRIFYVATSVDARFYLLKKEDDHRFKYISEFISPGLISSSRFANNYFYVLDQDSGLTVFADPSNLQNMVRYNSPPFIENQNLFVDSTYLILFSKERKLTVFTLKDFLPNTPILNEQIHKDLEPMYLIGQKLIFLSNDGLRLYSISNAKLKLLDETKGTGTTLNILECNNRLFSYNAEGKLFEYEYPIGDKLVLKSRNSLGYIPTSFNFNNDQIITTFVKTNRLYSFIDPYYSTNFSRLAFWRAGWKIFKDYPLFGVGDIDLAELYKVYKRPYDKEIQGHLHNNFFHSLATLGAVGCIAIMLLFLKIFLVHLSLVKKLKNIPFASSFALGAIGGYVSFVISGLTEYNFNDHEVITLVWFTLAISLAFSRTIKDQVTPKTS
jgi:hypothetical protein